MDLRKFNLLPEDIKTFIDNTAGYQPFILDDNKQVVARGYWPPPAPEYNWFYEQKKKANEGQTAHWGPGRHMVLDKQHVTPHEWDIYSRHNDMHNNMFDGFIESALSLVDTPSTVLEIGCNDGSLLLKALEAGCTSAIGYDLEPQHAAIFDLWNKVTDYDIKFINESYNSDIHSLPNCSSADIVIANAIMCHLSDPLHFIKFLSSITNKVLLISCGVDTTDGYTINFHGKPKRYGSGTFPNVFTHHTSISKPLFLYSLKECGFKNIYEIEHEPSWPPNNWYYGQNNMGFIATKD
jgi:SAM-dependent methyltransferase